MIYVDHAGEPAPTPPGYSLEIYDLIGLTLVMAGSALGVLGNGLGGFAQEFFAAARLKRDRQNKKAEAEAIRQMIEGDS